MKRGDFVVTTRKVQIPGFQRTKSAGDVGKIMEGARGEVVGTIVYVRFAGSMTAVPVDVKALRPLNDTRAATADDSQ